jgi:hypothetical protein
MCAGQQTEHMFDFSRVLEDFLELLFTAVTCNVYVATTLLPIYFCNHIICNYPVQPLQDMSLLQVSAMELHI